VLLRDAREVDIKIELEFREDHFLGWVQLERGILEVENDVSVV